MWISVWIIWALATIMVCALCNFFPNKYSVAFNARAVVLTLLVFTALSLIVWVVFNVPAPQLVL